MSPLNRLGNKAPFGGPSLQTGFPYLFLYHTPLFDDKNAATADIYIALHLFAFHIFFRGHLCFLQSNLWLGCSLTYMFGCILTDGLIAV